LLVFTRIPFGVTITRAHQIVLLGGAGIVAYRQAQPVQATAL